MDTCTTIGKAIANGDTIALIQTVVQGLLVIVGAVLAFIQHRKG